MDKVIKIIEMLLLEASVLLSSVNVPEEKQLADWRQAYHIFLDDWKSIEKYGDFSYLEFYFEEGYYFDKYFLSDVDGNGTPELFLYSTYMGLTAVFTYTDRPVYLLYDWIYGINYETDEVIIKGHWHGAGGSGEDEWKAYRITEGLSEYSMYIDFFDLPEEDGGKRYDIYDEKTDEYTHQQNGAEYDAIYAVHVEPCVFIDHYRLYDISDESGLDNIQ